MSSSKARASETPPQSWTVLSLIEWSTQYLVDRGFDEARLHVELLLAHVLQSSRLNLYLQFDRPLTSEELASFKNLFKRRLTHEPLQYILGETVFMGLRFTVDCRVLIPRPETELLVERAVEILNSSPSPNPRVLDIGSGSGNIALAIAHHAPKSIVESLDISSEALAIARENQQLLGVSNATFFEADIFAEQARLGTFEVIVSNPPYVSLQEFVSLQEEVRDFEPRLATTDEADGTRFLKRLARIAEDHLLEDGTLLVEIAYNQEAAVREILKACGPWDVEVFKDYAGLPRVVQVRRRSGRKDSLT